MRPPQDENTRTVVEGTGDESEEGRTSSEPEKGLSSIVSER